MKKSEMEKQTLYINPREKFTTDIWKAGRAGTPRADGAGETGE